MMSRTDKGYLLSLRKTLLANGVNLTFVLQGQASNTWRVIYSSLIETTLTLSLHPSPPLQWVISWLLSIGVTRNRCERDSCWFLFLIENLVDGWIDDILFACEHVLHWIYGVSLCFQNTCCAGADVKSKLILSRLQHCSAKDSQPKNKYSESMQNGKNYFWLTCNLWFFCDPLKADQCVAQKIH